MSKTAHRRMPSTSLSSRALCHDLVQYVAAATMVTAFPDDASLDPEIRHRFELIQLQLAQMRQLLQDCLDPEEVEGTADVVALVHGCVEAIAVRHDVELVVELPTAELRGNHQVLQRALNNMLDNAIRASHAADRVLVHVYGLDGHVVIEVNDKGAGFGRIDSGRGLGMVSVADALTSFNGALEIHSGPEPGTTVRLMLPWSRS